MNSNTKPDFQFHWKIRFYDPLLIVGLVLLGYYNFVYPAPPNIPTFNLLNDAWHFFYPVTLWAQDSYRAGILPLWCPYMELGYPYFADPQSMMYHLFTILLSFYKNSPPFVFQLQHVLNVTLLGFSMFFWLRTCRLSRWATFIGTVAWIYGGFAIGHTQHSSVIATMAVIPWVYAAFVALFRKPSIPLMFGCAIVVGLACLSGHPPLFIVAMMNLVLFGAVKFLLDFFNNNNQATFNKKTLLYGLGALFFGALIGMPEWLPTFYYGDLLVRGQAMDYYSTAVVNRMSPVALLSLVYPALLNVSSFHLYLGIFPLVFFLFAILLLDRRRDIGVLMILVAANMLVAVGSDSFARGLLNFLPVLDHIRNPSLAFRGFAMLFALTASMKAFDQVVHDSKLRKRLVRNKSMIVMLCVWIVFCALSLTHSYQLFLQDEFKFHFSDPSFSRTKFLMEEKYFLWWFGMIFCWLYFLIHRRITANSFLLIAFIITLVDVTSAFHRSQYYLTTPTGSIRQEAYYLKCEREAATRPMLDQDLQPCRKNNFNAEHTGWTDDSSLSLVNREPKLKMLNAFPMRHYYDLLRPENYAAFEPLLDVCGADRDTTGTAQYVFEMTGMLNFGAEDYDFLGDGWGTSETGGGGSFRWNTGLSSDVFVYMKRARDYRLLIDMAPFVYENWPGQGMEIIINGQLVRRFELEPGRKTLELEVEKSAWQVGENRIEFKLEHIEAVNSVVPDSEDDRELGVCFYTVRFEYLIPDKRPYIQDPAMAKRFRFFNQFEFVEDEQTALRRIGDFEIDPLKNLLLTGNEPSDSPKPSAKQANWRTRILRFRSNEIIIQLRTDTPGYLYLGEMFCPGWICTVNDQPTEVLRANYAFRANAVPAGTSEVRYTFRPKIFFIALYTMLTALAICFAGLLFGLLLRKKTESAGEDVEVGADGVGHSEPQGVADEGVADGDFEQAGNGPE